LKYHLRSTSGSNGPIAKECHRFLVAGPFEFFPIIGFTAAKKLVVGVIVVEIVCAKPCPKESKVRIVVWNCRMAFAKKRGLLQNLRPDIAVIPECSRDSVLACKDEGFEACWWGDNRNKGLGVLAAKPWTLESWTLERERRPTQKWIAPVRVHGPLSFLLVAVWACPVGGRRERSYIGQIFEAVTRHPKWFAGDRPVVMCGDFNSNAIWDHSRKTGNHSAVVKLLRERNLCSGYHTFFVEEQGRETRPTYYFWHREDRCFHIDYIFVPAAWGTRIKLVEVGTYKDWRPASDHMPIVLEVAEA
jgi:exonuclease III